MHIRNYIIADNQELTSLGLQSILQNVDQSVVFRATDKAGLTQLLKEHEDSLVILDYTLFDFVDENQLLIISERFALTTWLLLSDELTDSFLRKMIFSSHVFSVVFKDEPANTLRDAIKSASEGNRYLSQRATEKIINNHQVDEVPAVLTTTEMAIVKAIAQGKPTKEIARERSCSIHTINTHRKNIFRKLGINTAHEAVKYALRAGLVDPSDFYI